MSAVTRTFQKWNICHEFIFLKCLACDLKKGGKKHEEKKIVRISRCSGHGSGYIRRMCARSHTSADTTDVADGGDDTANVQRTYYYVGINHNHPYWYDVHQGFEFAAEQIGCKVVKYGPDDWDPAAQAQALEQAITKNPDGIITPVFDASILPALTKAAEAGIPVIAIESTMEGANVLSFIGLDNYNSGEQTAAKLIEEGGDSGKVVVMGNWGAANTDQKLDGFETYLAENSSWEVIAKLDDKAVTETAIEQAKTAFNNYSEMTAIVGLDSSSGAGIGGAMEELGLEPGSIVAVVHDREVTTLDYIKSGYVNCTLVNKTASMPYQALIMLEAINNGDMLNIPISADNAAADVNAIPETIYNGTVFVTQDNVDNFIVDNMAAYDSDLYQ